jgi:hypothetical protein
MIFSYNAVWEDAVRLLRRHGALLAAIAGVFLFLPHLLLAVLVPPPEAQPEDLAQALRLMSEYSSSAIPWVMLEAIVAMVGSLAMLRLIFAPGVTVGAALLFALRWLPLYVLISLILMLAFAVSMIPMVLGFGVIVVTELQMALRIVAFAVVFLLGLVPPLYLWARVSAVPSVMAAENMRNPISVIMRSVAITEGKGWAVFGLVFIVVIVGAIATGVADTMVGIIFALAAGPVLGKLLTQVFAAALSAALATVLLMLYAAIYRALTGATEQVARTFA